MPKTALMNTTEIMKDFTDVLYLTNKKQMLPEIRLLLKQKKLSFLVLSLDKFPQIIHQLDLIGTVIIDIENLEILQQQNLAKIIESLEINNIGILLLNNRVKLPVKSFSLASPQVKSFSLATTMESVSIDKLWMRISVNLAYRKKDFAMAVKPAMPPAHTRNSYKNKLAEQLDITGTLVENLTDQLHMAGLVQRDFLPSKLPNTDRIQWAAAFLPAEWVSGDIYDIVRIDEQHIGFYLADAVGHAMPAALLTIFIKQALVMRETIAESYRIFSPMEVISNLNKRMAGQKLSGYQFATCCYCMLNVKTLQLTYVRAGHPYPILIRPEKQPMQLEIRGSLLGIFEQAEYAQQTIQLYPGDKLLLYSDGAESFIGGFDCLAGFNFSDEFHKIKDLPIVDMINKFNTLARNQKVNPSQLDDITIVGLEILS